MDNRLLKVEEAAQILSLGRSKTYELIRSGALRKVYVGRAVRVRLADLDEFIQQLDDGV